MTLNLELLAKICGQFGSDNDGVRATAAAKAHQMIAEAGGSWGAILKSQAKPASKTYRHQHMEDWRCMMFVTMALSGGARLSRDEATTLLKVKKSKIITPDQKEMLGDLVERMKRGG
ncbi:MAG: hypothetical protein ACR2QF_14985 [Geminicoccaceae bacterium]